MSCSDYDSVSSSADSGNEHRGREKQYETPPNVTISTGERPQITKYVIPQRRIVTCNFCLRKGHNFQFCYRRLRACFRCGSRRHYIRFCDYIQTKQKTVPMNTQCNVETHYRPTTNYDKPRPADVRGWRQPFHSVNRFAVLPDTWTQSGEVGANPYPPHNHYLPKHSFHKRIKKQKRETSTQTLTTETVTPPRIAQSVAPETKTTSCSATQTDVPEVPDVPAPIDVADIAWYNEQVTASEKKCVHLLYLLKSRDSEISKLKMMNAQPGEEVAKLRKRVLQLEKEQSQNGQIISGLQTKYNQQIEEITGLTMQVSQMKRVRVLPPVEIIDGSRLPQTAILREGRGPIFIKDPSGAEKRWPQFRNLFGNPKMKILTDNLLKQVQK